MGESDRQKAALTIALILAALAVFLGIAIASCLLNVGLLAAYALRATAWASMSTGALWIVGAAASVALYAAILVVVRVKSANASEDDPTDWLDVLHGFTEIFFDLSTDHDYWPADLKTGLVAYLALNVPLAILQFVAYKLLGWGLMAGFYRAVMPFMFD